MRSLHLFAGAGGGLLADLILGHQPVGAVELDPYCCSILRARRDDGWFPWLRVHEQDIRMFDPSEYTGRVDIVSGGFPCQDVSSAGKGAGIAGERSGLWSEFARVLGVVRPRFAFIENSPLLSRRGLHVILSDLAALGYDAEWQVISAAQVSAPHKRERIWILAHSQLYGLQDCVKERAETAAAWGPRHGDNTQGRKAQPPIRSLADGVAHELVPGWWESEPSIGRVAAGVPNRVSQIKALGNGQVPLQAAFAWTVLMGLLHQ